MYPYKPLYSLEMTLIKSQLDTLITPRETPSCQAFTLTLPTHDCPFSP